MRFARLSLGLFALTLFLLPALTAQEKKADAKADKKEAGDEKKDAKADKKDDKKGDEKKDTEKPETPEKKEPAAKEKKPPEEKLEHGPVFKAKIISMKPESAHDFTIEWPMPDPQKMMNLQNWQMQQMAAIANDRDPRSRMNRMYQFQMQLAQKQSNINETHTMKPVDVRATDACKVRIMYPPVQYDDSGNLKKWTKKELDKLRGGSKLPGYPADFDLLKTGQFVELYLARPHASLPSKGKTAKAPPPMKKKDEDAPDPMEVTRPEVVMIVIWAEPTGR